MRVKRVVLGLCAMALSLVLAAPTYAQTVTQGYDPANPVATIIIENNVNGMPIVPAPAALTAIVPSFTSNLTLSSPGTSVVSVLGQVAQGTYNAIGPTFAVGVGVPNLPAVGGPPLNTSIPSSYDIQQGAGTFTVIVSNTPTLLSGSVTLNAVNQNTVNNAGLPALSSVIAGGNQRAVNSINVANIAPAESSTGSLTQTVGNTLLNAQNLMTATVQNGTATVMGQASKDAPPPTQYASGTLNTGAVFVTGNTTYDILGNLLTANTLTLTQKMTAPNTIYAINTAIANAVTSASSQLDPSVQNLGQISFLGVSNLGLAGTGQGTVPSAGDGLTLDGSQTTLTSPANGVNNLLAYLGNTAVAYAGNPATANLANAFGAFNPAILSNGIASVSGVTQNTTVNLNTVYQLADNPATDLNLANSANAAAGFTQTANGATVNVQLIGNTPFVNAGDTVAFNAILANSNIGSASISGVSSQAFTNLQNALGAGGTLSGKATQTAVAFTPAAAWLGGRLTTLGAPAALGTAYNNGATFGAGYANVAIADTISGPSSVTGLTQTMDQSLNSVTGGSANGLTLNQVAGGSASANAANNVNLASNNLQVALGSTTAAISGASQSVSQSLNTMTAGPTSGLILNQTAGNAGVVASPTLTVASNNLLYASGPSNASVSGSQSGLGSVNVANLGSVSGGSVTQVAFNVNVLNSNTMAPVSSFNASAVGTQSAVSAVNVIGH